MTKYSLRPKKGLTGSNGFFQETIIENHLPLFIQTKFKHSVFTKIDRKSEIIKMFSVLKADNSFVCLNHARTGVAATPSLSTAASLTPRLILKYPFSPQLSPQLFLMIQYFSPDVLSTPYPTKSTPWLVT